MECSFLSLFLLVLTLCSMRLWPLWLFIIGKIVLQIRSRRSNISALHRKNSSHSGNHQARRRAPFLDILLGMSSWAQTSRTRSSLPVSAPKGNCRWPFPVLSKYFRWIQRRHLSLLAWIARSSPLQRLGDHLLSKRFLSCLIHRREKRGDLPPRLLNRLFHLADDERRGIGLHCPQQSDLFE